MLHPQNYLVTTVIHYSIYTVIYATITSGHLYCVTRSREFFHGRKQILGNCIDLLDEENTAIISVNMIETQIVLCTSKRLHCYWSINIGIDQLTDDL